MQNLIKHNVYKRCLKRPMDFMLSLFAIIVLSPALFFITILVRLKLGSPVIFEQKRPGLNERIFAMYKFRTMTNQRDAEGNLMPDNIRLTKFGKLLRATSLDELPELFNILKGDMSIIGPRPQLIQDMVFMTLEQRRRHSVMPGLSGWAQVNGRNGITWEEKLGLDLEYVNNITFLKDFKIVLLTIVKVLKREGVNANGMDTAEDYGDYLLRNGSLDQAAYRHGLEKSRQISL